MKTLKYHQELDISSRLGYTTKILHKIAYIHFFLAFPSIFTRIFAQLLDEIFADRMMRCSN